MKVQDITKKREKFTNDESYGNYLVTHVDKKSINECVFFVINKCYSQIESNSISFATEAPNSKLSLIFSIAQRKLHKFLVFERPTQCNYLLLSGDVFFDFQFLYAQKISLASHRLAAANVMTVTNRPTLAADNNGVENPINSVNHPKSSRFKSNTTNCIIFRMKLLTFFLGVHNNHLL